MKACLRWIAVLLCMALFCGCSYSAEVQSELPAADDTVVTTTYENNVLTSGLGYFGDLPKGLRPMLMVGGKLFRWTGMSKEFHIMMGGVHKVGDTTTFLPDGYIAVGDISGITEEVPSKELQLRAGFEATGTVFVNKETPEVVYVLMTTDWFESSYIRFASDDLHDNECIAYQGRQYRFNADIGICDRIWELPESCERIGTLRYIGTDRVPVNDLETNRISDGYAQYVDGREVYADPDDPSVLYVYECQYSREGTSPGWRVCREWT